MNTVGSAGIRHALLEERGVLHAFGVPVQPARRRVVRPQQVHGRAVARVRAGRADPEEADAIVSVAGESAGPPIGIVTADCLPILACSRPGDVVGAIHAGWRGLAAGVVEAGIRALRRNTDDPGEICAVIGPHIAICCYEVDAVVLEPLQRRFGPPAVAAATVATRPGHRRLSLARLAMLELARVGIGPANRACMEDCCTFCDPRGFDSFRRDGEAAGRMLHHIAPA